MNLKSDLDIQFFLHLGYFPGYQPSVKLDFSGIDRKRYAGQSREDLLAEGIKLWRRTISDLFESGRRHIVPISGGMDSRAILCALLEHAEASRIETYTFGTPGTYDFDIGCLVAKEAGTRHTPIPLDRVEWTREDFEQAAGRFDHQTFLFHHAPIWLLEQFSEGITWSGYIGDAVTGGHLKDDPAPSIEAARIRYLERRLESRSVRLAMREPGDFIPLLGGGAFPVNFLSFDEQILFTEVGKITAPHVLMKGFHYNTPFINSPFWNFAMSIPDEFRKGQNLFIEMMLKYYPGLFYLPTKSRFGLSLNSTDREIFIRRARNKIWNLGRTHFMNFNWPALPMTNFFDIDAALRTNNALKQVVHAALANLAKRDAVPWIDIGRIWERHARRKANHGDAIKILFSLERNLDGLEKNRVSNVRAASK